MARLSPAPPEQYIPVVGPDAALNLRIWSNRPELAAAFVAFSGAVFGTERILPSRVLELARLRIAFHNQCRSCMAVRYVAEQEVPEGLVCSLEKPGEAQDLTDAERMALEFADRLATDHLSVDDAFYDRLRQYYTEAEIVELGVNMALCVGFGRLEATWDMVDELPERFARRGVVITPWGDGEVVRPSTT
jgi:alkylhydroperoxidase family enzyme